VLLSEYPSGLSINSILMAKNFSINPNYVAVGNGAAELIKTIFESINDKCGVILPTFEEYPNRLMKDQIVSYIPDNNNFSYTADDLIRFFNDKKLETFLLI